MLLALVVVVAFAVVTIIVVVYAVVSSVREAAACGTSYYVVCGVFVSPCVFVGGYPSVVDPVSFFWLAWLSSVSFYLALTILSVAVKGDVDFDVCDGFCVLSFVSSDSDTLMIWLAFCDIGDFSPSSFI